LPRDTDETRIRASDRASGDDYDGAMNGSTILGIAALLTLLPAAFWPGRRGPDQAYAESGTLFWLLVGVASVGPVALEIAAGGGVWQSGFSATLWSIVSATMIVFVLVSIFSEPAHRFRVLLMPYVAVLAVIALLWSSVSRDAAPVAGMTTWLQVHIAVSLATYALITLSATAALGVWLKERALRKRTARGWTEALPAVADGEHLQRRLLLCAEIVLGLGLISGMGAQFLSAGSVIAFDHKTVLSFAAFVVLGILLLMQHSSGLRGRSATRFVLIVYLLITLAFPGVKFVTDIILS